VTDLQREWEEILESHGLPADRGDTVLDQVTYLGNPRAFADEESEYSTFIDSVETEQPWWLEPSGYAVPVRVVTPEELAKLDPGGCALTFFVDLRTKHRRDKWRPELQAARFRGRHHSAETRRRIGEANRKTYWAKTPEERAKSLANRVYKKCEPGCTCAKHDPEVCTKRREKLRGKKHNVSPEGLWRQDVARRRRSRGQMFLPLAFS
jgi:hypothetical protein